ncbi:hypothetical protein L6164_009447 [Bauhinia variegata]|uniref:Uncharacterized protein n=1 Tax=Bauhinia variegata TaxID=167791 RepID=A0ACB9PJR5_BAUVA|nr:hypothetical protein L6164_009447 [Bauhinia variegata]
MKITSCRILGAVLALTLVHFLFFSSFRLHHEQSFSREKGLSRKLLSPSFESLSTSMDKYLKGSRKQTKKAVEPSLRKAPPSVPNPTQNK